MARGYFSATTEFVDDKYCIAKIRRWYDDVSYSEYTGIAACNPNDKFDLEVGIQLALSRALENCAKGLKKAAWDKVKARDAEKAAIKAKKRRWTDKQIAEARKRTKGKK